MLTYGRAGLLIKSFVTRKQSTRYYCANSHDTAESLREAFRIRPQPVAIITACEPDQQPRGITVSSFTSLSMDPPRVTFNVKTPSRALSAMRHGFFANLLTHSPKHVEFARKFAMNESTTEGDWYRNEEFWKTDETGVPVLRDSETTRIYCTTERLVDVGDHCIVIGRVERIDRAQGRPSTLLYRDHKFFAG